MAGVRRLSTPLVVLAGFLRYRKVKLTTNFHCGSLRVVYRNQVVHGVCVI